MASGTEHMFEYSDKEDSLFLNSKAVSECIKSGDFLKGKIMLRVVRHEINFRLCTTPMMKKYRISLINTPGVLLFSHPKLKIFVSK